MHNINYTHKIKSIFLILGLCSIVSCKSKNQKKKYKNLFRYNEHTNVSSLDPAFANNLSNVQLTNQIFSGLVQLDDSLRVKPDIAKSWDISNRGKTYTFTLRNDIYFHKHSLFGEDSTRVVLASDIKYSLERLSDPNLASPGGWTQQNVKAIEVISDTVVRIHLKEAFPPFLSLLSVKYTSVVPREIVEYYKDDFRINPIGTGPFYMKLWKENTKLVLRKNSMFYQRDSKGQQIPYLEAISVTFLPDKQIEFMQFIQGNLDYISGLDASFKDEVLTREGELKLSYKDKIKLTISPLLNTEYIGIYMGIDNILPTGSLEIRQAMNYGFDRKKMIRYLRNNIGFPANSGFIPIGLPSFRDTIYYEYNPVKAKSLVDKYIELNDNKFPQIKITTNSQYVDLCEYIQKEWEKIGIQTQVEVVSPSVLRQDKATGKLPIFRASWVADYPDAQNYLSLFYSKNFTPNGPNYTHFNSILFDELYESSLKETIDSIRYNLYREMDALVMEQAPIIPLYYDQIVRFTQNDVRGLGKNSLNLLNLKYVYKFE